MSVQFNLLPDVKLQYVKTQAVRNRVTAISVVLSVVALAFLAVMLIFVYGIQKKQLSDAATSVTNASNQLKSIPNVADAVTIENQLKTLVVLHQNKHMVGRIFTYLSQLTPANLSIGQLNMDMTNNSMDISGNADSQKTVNAFVDTLKATTFQIGGGPSNPAFTSVVESDFTINAANVSYKLNLQFDPGLFANNDFDSQGKPQTPKLSVPSQQTTQTDIFKAQTSGG